MSTRTLKVSDIEWQDFKDWMRKEQGFMTLAASSVLKLMDEYLRDKGWVLVLGDKDGRSPQENSLTPGAIKDKNLSGAVRG
jgi:hypothetical protein